MVAAAHSENHGRSTRTAGAYLRDTGVAMRPPGGWGRGGPAKPAIEVTTDFGADSAALQPSISPYDDGGPLSSDGDTGSAPAKAATEVTTDFGVDLADQSTPSTPQPAISPSASACERHRDAIEVGLSRGRNAMAIWQDLVDACGFAGGYQSVKRFVRKLRGTQSKGARAVIETAPGEEARVDYGTGPMVRDAQSGKYRHTRLLVLTLGYSRKSVRLLVLHSSSQIWAELHEKAFRRLGGCTRVVVLDNLREGVLKPGIYDPTLNPLYRDVLAHYGAVPLPCRVAHPDRKGRAESGVGHAQKMPLKGLRFESPAETQAYLDQWEARWADARIHGTTKRQVAAMFAEERPALLPLPVEPFRYYQYGERTVHLDGCVEVEAACDSGRPCGGSGKHRAVAGQHDWNWGYVRGWQAIRLAAGSALGISRRPRLYLWGFRMLLQIAKTSVIVRGVLAQPTRTPCTDPYARWCGRGRRVTAAPMPIKARGGGHRPGMRSLCGCSFSFEFAVIVSPPGELEATCRVPPYRQCRIGAESEVFRRTAA
jgi:transposase